MSALGLYDLLTLIVGAVGYGIGRKRGLVWQLSGIATLIVGGVCATILCNPLGPLIHDGLLGRFAAWIGVYAAVSICLYLISLRLKHRLEEAELDELDERFGGMLGVIKSMIAFGAVTMVAVGISDRIAGAVRRSASGRGLYVLVNELEPYLPEQIERALKGEEDPVAGGEGAAGPPAPTPSPSPAPPAERPGVSQPPSRPARPAPARQPAQPAPSARPSRPEPAPEPLPDPTLEPEPEPEPEPDPFDPHQGPTDPLAPPR